MSRLDEQETTVVAASRYGDIPTERFRGLAGEALDVFNDLATTGYPEGVVRVWIEVGGVVTRWAGSSPPPEFGEREPAKDPSDA